MGHDELLEYAKKVLELSGGKLTRDSLMALLPKEADIMSKMEIVSQLSPRLAA